jgi:hypothetical protein
MPIILATQEAEIQEDHGSKPANSLWDSYLEKNPSRKKGLVEWLKQYEHLPSKWGPKFKPQCHQK